MDSPRPVPLGLVVTKTWKTSTSGGRPGPVSLTTSCARPAGHPGADLDRPPRRHRLDGVADEVDHDLLHLLGVHAHPRQGAVRLVADLHRAAPGPRGPSGSAPRRRCPPAVPGGTGCGRCARTAGSRRPGPPGGGSPRGSRPPARPSLRPEPASQRPKRRSRTESWREMEFSGFLTSWARPEAKVPSTASFSLWMMRAWAVRSSCSAARASS